MRGQGGQRGKDGREDRREGKRGREERGREDKGEGKERRKKILVPSLKGHSYFMWTEQAVQIKENTTCCCFSG